MTKFNPKNKETLTYGECLDPAMKITDENDAKQYLKNYISFTQKMIDENPREDDITAEQIAKSNLGYYAGYYDNEIRKRVEKLFRCSHPIFGNIKNKEVISPRKAFEMGENYKKRKNKTIIC